VSAVYEGGAVGSFIGSSAARGKREETVRIWGTDGHVELKPEAALYTLRALDGVPTGQWVPVNGGRLPTRAMYISRFVSAVAAGRAPDVTALDGLAVQAFVEAAYRSARSRRGVRPADLLSELGMPSKDML
jgi:predicted dehydrogenase